MILADFDSYIMPRDGIKGMNAPMVTHKLRDPTEWSTYSSYLVPRGHADICFPSDFHFLQHAYSQITGKNASIYKNQEFVKTYALENWAETENLYNPLKEEYFNTSFFVTES